MTLKPLMKKQCGNSELGNLNKELVLTLNLLIC